MSKHTPGPWKPEYLPTQAGHVWKINPIGGCIYVDTGGGVCRKDKAGAEADARLIARAPDLLVQVERLSRLVRAVRSSEFKGTWCDDIDGRNWFDLRDEVLAAVQTKEEPEE